jgi:dolichyl-diphosphooligosaccharide--protein glycosyltransferase/undecaprenyl-diphosphooligosaccharide--protein glycosyltransferase
MHGDNPRLPDMMAHGTIAITVLLVHFTPFSLESVILYLPAIISSLVVIPIILIARLYNLTLWGFLSALLGSIAWSYYNRTMVGYYDTDMFSAMAPMFILYFLMKSTMDFNLKSALYAGLFIAIYPFLYDQGKAIIFSMGIMYALYLIFYQHKDKVIYKELKEQYKSKGLLSAFSFFFDEKTETMTYLSLIIIFISLIPIPLVSPYSYLVKSLVIIVLYFIFKTKTIKKEEIMLLTVLFFVLFMFLSNVFSLIFYKVFSYISTGTVSEGLHFYGVKQTVREASAISFETFSNRISGSQLGAVISLIGYGVLVYRKPAFILALPLMGIGVFAIWGGLRFTVYSVPVFALSAIYLFWVIGEYIKDKRLSYAFVFFATIAMITPNIIHIIGYKVPTVLNKTEVQDLDKLRQMSSPQDYTLAWWDYGYPIWFYSNTNTLIDGGKHNNDNFIISQIMQTTSQDLAANLSRLAVETYVDSNYAIVANTLFKNRTEEQLNPNLFLSELKDSNYVLPKKTRDIYLYLPYRMLNIFPTVAVFGNLNLNTGKKLREMTFYPTTLFKNEKGILRFRNGIVFDSKKGEVSIGSKQGKVKYFITTQNTSTSKIQMQSQVMNIDGDYAIVYMKSYNKFIIMDTKTFNSTYVQMFILGKYDKNLYELVVSSAYSKIYKLKK